MTWLLVEDLLAFLKLSLTIFDAIYSHFLMRSLIQSKCVLDAQLMRT